jgi:uncharacterized protein YjbI with pentapeptide repeats
MDEKNDKPDEQPSVSPESDEKAIPELREISEEELRKTLEDHKMWLESEGIEGSKADLRNVNLAGANLREANLIQADLREAYLIGANLWKANLQESDLYRSNLREAFLSGANLQKANLHGANFNGANLVNTNCKYARLSGANLQNVDLTGAKDLSESDLKYANLEGAVGLLGNEFARSNITGTKLPDEIKEFKNLQIVEEISKNGRRILFTMLIVCIYSWVVVSTTTDVRLLTNSASTTLPVIGTGNPTALIYLAAPLFLLGFYFYFHTYLHRLWTGLAKLPAVFPDSLRLDVRAYPWLMNSLVRRHFEQLKEERSLIDMAEEWLAIFLAWWAVPLTVIGFWLRYLPRREWVGTWLHIGLLAGTVALTIIFYRLCAKTLRGEQRKPILWKTIWFDERFYYALTPILSGLLFLLVSYGAINGIRHTFLEKKINYFKITEVVPWVFQKVGYDPFANFREKDVSIRPNDYYRIESAERQLESVKGANLKGRDLRFADMDSAFLVKADMREANLQEGKLRKANLQKVNLWKANLQNAALGEANLQEANLEEANLQNADLWQANLRQADLYKANLPNAVLAEANLQKANLFEADLREAYLIGANLWKANLNKANLGEAKLQQANLQGANLQNADLQEANLRGANLKEANLRGAELGGLLTEDDDGTVIDPGEFPAEQLCKAKTLYNTILDQEIEEQVKKTCSQLMVRPHWVDNSDEKK